MSPAPAQAHAHAHSNQTLTPTAVVRDAALVELARRNEQLVREYLLRLEAQWQFCRLWNNRLSGGRPAPPPHLAGVNPALPPHQLWRAIVRADGTDADDDHPDDWAGEAAPSPATVQ